MEAHRTNPSGVESQKTNPDVLSNDNVPAAVERGDVDMPLEVSRPWKLKRVQIPSRGSGPLKVRSTSADAGSSTCGDALDRGRIDLGVRSKSSAAKSSTVKGTQVLVREFS